MRNTATDSTEVLTVVVVAAALVVSAAFAGVGFGAATTTNAAVNTTTTPTGTPTPTADQTPTGTPTPTDTPTGTPTPTDTPTSTPDQTPTPDSTPIPNETATPTPTPDATPTPTSGGGGGGSAGPLGLAHDDTVSTTGGFENRGSTREPRVTFNRSVVIEGTGDDGFVIENADTGSVVQVIPEQRINVSATTALELEVVTGNGTADTAPSIEREENGTSTDIPAAINGSFATFAEPYSNLTVTFVKNGTPVASTGNAAIHPVDYRGAFQQNSTEGTVLVSVGRDGLPKQSMVQYSVFTHNVSAELSYNATVDAFRGTLDVSSLANDTYEAGAFFTHPEDGFYFGSTRPLEVNGTSSPSPTDNATVSIRNQTTDGTSLVVESTTVPAGGFVVIHDTSLLQGETFDSVRGASDYLTAGSHTNVTVRLDDPMSANQTVLAMPHRDTDDDQRYDFVRTDGADDGPYTDSAGNVVVDSASATVDLSNEPGAVSVQLTPAAQQFEVGDTVAYRVEVLNASAGVGAYNITVAPTNGPPVELVDVRFPDADHTSAELTPNGLQLRAAGLDRPVEAFDRSTVATIVVRGNDTGTGTFEPTVETVADERGLEYGVNEVSGGEFDVTRPSLSLSLTVEKEETPLGGENSYLLVAENVTGGVGAVNVTFTVENATVADVIGGNVTGSPDNLTRTNGTANGVETFTIRADGMSTPDNGTFGIAGVTLEGAEPGSTSLTAEATSVTREDGLAYAVTNAPSAPVVVPSPAVEVGVLPEGTSAQPGETFTVDIATNTNSLGVYGEEFTLAFNESLLNATDVSKGPFLGSDGATTTAYGTGIDNRNGTLNFGVSRQNTQEPISGTGVVATVTFRVDANATRGVTSPLALTTVKVSDEEANELDTTAYDASVLVPESLPPELAATLVSTVPNEGQPVVVDTVANDSDGVVSNVTLESADGSVITNATCGSASCEPTLRATPRFSTWNGSAYVNATVVAVATDDRGAEASVTLEFPVYTAGDANGDGVVDIFDATEVGTSWNTQRGDPGYSDAADQNNDGVVDIFDATILGTNWNDQATTNSSSS
ncbi:DUF7282 domain-containing protein [Halorarius halobius]|uniref:DUF7282 domain-containing protein n=1 Tax=Halorarius halobius TaxID=2962671 RepID=UPI0020CFCD71|nr:cohesin domain-containing protein [Halorarius halobius]